MPVFPAVFLGFQKGGGRPSECQTLAQSIGYTQIETHTAHDLCELLPLVVEDTEKRNPTAARGFEREVASETVE